MSVAGTVPIAGHCDPRFTQVRQAFESNFALHGELGAAVSVYREGRKVVDLWGGWAECTRTRPWTEHTLVNVFSVGKGIATLGVLDCVARGISTWMRRSRATGHASPEPTRARSVCVKC
jgi:CubicO group peptidase (beta-lactamase class C family)